ncbi:MAG TPA: ATPase domain-containing protein [Thermoanaerobaculia bacterium]|nr:ATPase domain-containing protein [Thermoanaerobaculia bacterium]
MTANGGSRRDSPDAPVAATGIEGLDDILGGGFPRDRLYLVVGDPGVGKTTLALQFLLEGVRRGERGVCIALSETEEEMRVVAASHGWSLDGIALQQVSDTDGAPEEDNTLFHSSEVELAEATKSLLAEIRRVDPVRVVFDSLTEIRLLAQSPLRFRRQVLGLKQFFAGRHCTVLMIEDRMDGRPEVESVVHGILHLEQLAPEYGAERRRLRVSKLRGVRFRGGYHDYKIKRGGLAVYPRLIAAEHRTEFPGEAVPSGLPRLDEMLGGGLERGTSALFMGPAGTGKSVLAMQYAIAAAKRGEPAFYFTFDEGSGTLFARSEGLGQPVRELVGAGKLSIHQIDPAERSPGEFACRVLEAVEKEGARVVAVDSLNGYMLAMPEERFLSAQLHELFSYLRQRGVLALSTMAQHGFLGTAMPTPVDISYLADTVVLLRYFETAGAVHKAISIAKKRSGPHESTIREYGMTSRGIEIGEPLRDFQGIMTGVPIYGGGYRGAAEG